MQHNIVIKHTELRKEFNTMEILDEIIPKRYRDNIEKAIRILKEQGCAEVYIFGSLARGDYNQNSDIDIAIRGLESKKFFKVIGELLGQLELPFDLVDLDEKDNNFAQFIQKKGMIRVA